MMSGGVLALMIIARLGPPDDRERDELNCAQSQRLFGRPCAEIAARRAPIRNPDCLAEPLHPGAGGDLVIRSSAGGYHSPRLLIPSPPARVLVACATSQPSAGSGRARRHERSLRGGALCVALASRPVVLAESALLAAGAVDWDSRCIWGHAVLVRQLSGRHATDVSRLVADWRLLAFFADRRLADAGAFASLPRCARSSRDPIDAAQRARARHRRRLASQAWPRLVVAQVRYRSLLWAM